PGANQPKELVNADLNEESLTGRDCLKGQNVSLDDLQEAEMFIIRYGQWERFHSESVTTKENDIYKLHLGNLANLLKVGGPLNKAPALEDKPVIVAKDLHVSKLRLLHVHERTGAQPKKSHSYKQWIID
ncbi:uncharacterized protein DAT39_018887, partial [Clarias magur]